MLYCCFVGVLFYCVVALVLWFVMCCCVNCVLFVCCLFVVCLCSGGSPLVVASRRQGCCSIGVPPKSLNVGVLSQCFSLAVV